MYSDEVYDLLLLLFLVFPVICEDKWDTQGQKHKQKGKRIYWQCDRS